MNWKSTLVLGVLALGMLAYLQWGVIRPHEEETEKKEQEAKVFSEDLSSLTSIRLLHAKDEEIVLSQKEGRWNLEKPIKDIVSASQLETLLNHLKMLKIKGVLVEGAEFEARKDSLDQYGIHPNSFTVELQFFNHKKTIRFGNMLAQGFDLYAKIDDDPRVLLVDSSMDVWKMNSAEELREKRLINVDTSALRRVQIQLSKGNARLLFEREASDKPWTMKEPFQLPLDQEFTQARLSKIGLVQASRFLEKIPPSLSKPEVFVKVLFDDQTRDARSPLNDPLPHGAELRLASVKRADAKKDDPDSFTYYAQSDKSPPAEIARFHMENLNRPATDYIDRRFDDFLGSEVVQFEVFAQGESVLSAARDPQGKIELRSGQEKVEGNSQSFDQAIEHLRNLVALQFVGLAKPPSSNKTAWGIRLRFSNQSTRYFYVEDPSVESRLWTDKAGQGVEYRLRAKALDPQLFSLDRLKNPPQKPTAKDDADQKKEATHERKSGTRD